jgi:hypothetical protein
VSACRSYDRWYGNAVFVCQIAFLCPVCLCQRDCFLRSSPPLGETLPICCQGIASSTWSSLCHHMFLTH